MLQWPIRWFELVCTWFLACLACLHVGCACNNCNPNPTHAYICNANKQRWSMWGGLNGGSKLHLQPICHCRVTFSATRVGGVATMSLIHLHYSLPIYVCVWAVTYIGCILKVGLHGTPCLDSNSQDYNETCSMIDQRWHVSNINSTILYPINVIKTRLCWPSFCEYLPRLKWKMLVFLLKLTTVMDLPFSFVIAR